jgi:hypothetical protein
MKSSSKEDDLALKGNEDDRYSQKLKGLANQILNNLPT